VQTDAVLVSLAESIADGRPADWDAAEPHLGAEERAVLRQLRVVSALALLHRTLPVPPDDSAMPRVVARPLSDASIGTWGPLVLLERLGSGTSGEVFRAWDQDLERDVALKLLREDPGADLQTSHITAEARLLARIRHPNVVAVHGVASHDGRVGLWMDLVQGATLEEFVAVRGTLSAEAAARVGIELCRALAAIHAAGLVHRDIKTQNVMREESGRIVLMDLGTGHELTPDPALVPRDVAGTPLYIAPEIFGGDAASVRTDLYSVGVLLYRLVTASFPVLATTVEELRAHHADQRAIPLSEARPDLPAPFVRIVDRALARNPEDRPPSADAFEADLARALEDITASRTVPTPPAKRKWAAWHWGALAAATVAVTLLGGRQWLVSRQGPSTSTIDSIVVLPLENVSRNAADDYLADGLTEELIGALGRLNGLNVISRTSAMRFKGAKTPLPEIARALHVDAALEGSIFVVHDSAAGPPSRVRVSARLIQAGTDSQIWNDTFEVALTDVMALQGRIAKAVADRINLHLSSQQQNALTTAARGGVGGQEVTVFDLYLRGRYEANTRTTEGLQRSILYFQEAIDRDPRFARAYAGLADAYTLLAVYGHAPRGDAAERATAAATTALTLDQSLAEAHASLGLIAEERFEWDAAEEHFQRATALKPGYSSAHHWYADFLSRRGRVKEAVAEINAAHALDPLSPAVNVVVGSLQIFARDYDAAVAQLEKTVQIDQSFGMSHLALAEAYGYTHDFTRALAEADIAAAALANPVSAGTRGFILASAGRRTEAERIADDLAARYARQEPDVAAAAAVVLAGLRQTDEALTWLERAADRQEPWVGYIAVDPRFDSLRSDARFAKLLATLGIAR
jgi:serine/threonine protein kinase/tetratricopeptide (TPR) repeat protein